MLLIRPESIIDRVSRKMDSMPLGKHETLRLWNNRQGWRHDWAIDWHATNNMPGMAAGNWLMSWALHYLNWE